MSSHATVTNNGMVNGTGHATPNEEVRLETGYSNTRDLALPLTDTPAEAIDCDMVLALRKLARAFELSRDCERPKWDFAVALADLEQMGVSHDELRWLIGKEFVEHAQEVVAPGGIRRSFDSPGGFAFTTQSCFVITDPGLQFANNSASLPLRFESGRSDQRESIRQPSNEPCHPSPYWDSQRHELRIGKLVVKRFKWRALNQEAILAAFQEDEWPPRIDDPLPPIPNIDPKRRLSDAIKCLNRKQQNPCLRFSGDGTGEGVLWDLVMDFERSKK